MSIGARRQVAWSCTTLALAGLLNGTGCLRFAYNEVDRQHGSTRDAGMDAGASQYLADASSQMDAQLPAAGGSGGVGGTGLGSGGSGGSVDAAGGSGSQLDAGGTELRDAAVDDAGVTRDAGEMDASMPAADGGGVGGVGAGGGGQGGMSVGGGGSGGSSAGGMGGAGGTGGAGTGGALAFANCLQGTGVLFCNGFEEALPWKPPYDGDKITSGSTEQRSTSRKYFGAASAHMSTTLNGRDTGARVAWQQLGKKKTGDFWLRYYYYIPSTVTINPYFSAGVMSELTDPYWGFSLLIYPTTINIESGLMSSNPVAFTFPRDKWVCVEHHVFVNASTGYFEIFVDGLRKIKTKTGNTVPGSGWSSAEVGIHYVGEGQGPVEVYVDNVVVSKAQYGCD